MTVTMPDFVEDQANGGTAAFLGRLDPEERDTLFELVENDVRAGIQEELFSRYGAEIDILRGLIKPLSLQVERAVRSEMNSIARGTVELALALGELLARQAIATDEAYLVRTVRELVERTVVGAELTIIANPKEIQKLRKCETDLEDLNVVALVPDMALEVGGCIVQSAGQEWDVTFRGQADALAEMVRDTLIYGGHDLDSGQSLFEVAPEQEIDPGNEDS